MVSSTIYNNVELEKGGNHLPPFSKQTLTTDIFSAENLAGSEICSTFALA